MKPDIIDKKLLKLNLGCGLSAPSGWINIDGSITARLSKWKWLYKTLCRITGRPLIEWPDNIQVKDITKGLPFPNGSTYAIYSSHMLEHLDFEAANYVIKECYRCLISGGIIRIIVPDLHQIAKTYVKLMNDSPSSEHSRNFLKNFNIDERSLKGIRKIFFDLFRHSKHIYMYDESSLKELLQKHKFRNVQRMSYGQSLISDITKAEDKDRLTMSICIEAIKED